jgi:hypothetical protein
LIRIRYPLMIYWNRQTHFYFSFDIGKMNSRTTIVIHGTLSLKPIPISLTFNDNTKAPS